LVTRIPTGEETKWYKERNMSRRIFISYNFKDREIAHNIRPYFQSNGGTCQGKPLFIENDVSGQGDKAIDLEVRRIMKKCNIALFVIGDNVHSSPWINREAELAVSMDLKLAGVRFPKSNGGVPNILKHHKLPIAKWNQKDLAKVLNKL